MPKQPNPSYRPTEAISLADSFSIDPDSFEHLCQRLLELEDGIDYSLLHEVSGNNDFGVDVRGFGHDGKSVVVQCKAVRKFGPADIKKASDAFLDHWESKWKVQKVSKFVLAVSREIRSAQAQDQLQQEMGRFGKLGLRYELWSASRILAKLEPHRALAKRFLEPTLVEKVYGGQTELSFSTKLRLRDLETNLDHHTARLKTMDITRLKALREKWRAGKQATVESELDGILREMAADTCWLEQREAYLHFAVQVYSSTNTEKARAKLQDLERDFPKTDLTLLKGLLLASEGEPGEALELLEPLTEDAAAELRATIRLNEGDVAGSLNLLERLESKSPIALEILAICFLLEGQIEESLRNCRLSLELAPSASANLTLCKILFYRSLSPAARPASLRQFLSLVDPALIRFGEDVSADVAELRTRLLHLVETVESENLVQEATEWLFASYCLFEQDAHDEKAEQLFRSEWEKLTPSYVVLAWGVVYLDLSSLVALEERLLSLFEDREQYIVPLVHFYLKNGRVDEARALVEKQIEDATDSGKKQFLEHLLSSCYDKRGTDSESLQVSVKAEDEEVAPSQMRELMLLKSAAQDWVWLEEHSSRLLQSQQTVEALSIVTAALYNQRKFEACLALLELTTVPAPLLMRNFYCYLALGQVVTAEEFFQEIGLELTGLERLRCQLALAYERGLVEPLPLVGRELLNEPEATSEDLLNAAVLLKTENGVLAEELLFRALESQLPKRLYPQAFHLGLQLGLGSHPSISSLFGQLRSSVDEDESPVKLLKPEQVMELVETGRQNSENLVTEQRCGRCPYHVFCEILGLPLSAVFFSWTSANRRNSHPLRLPSIDIKSGKQKSEQKIPSAPVLNLDLSSIFVLNQLNLLRDLGKFFPAVRIPASWRRAFRIEKDNLASSDPETEEFQAALERHRRKGLLRFEGDGQAQVTLESVLYSLWQDGRVDEAEYRRAANEVRSSGADSHENLQKGTRLHLDIPQIRFLWRMKILESALHFFSVAAPRHFESHLDRNLEAQSERASILDKLERLEQRLVILMTEPEWSEREATLASDELKGPYSRVVFELFKFVAQPDDVLVIDDRFYSSRLYREPKVPILTSYDILCYLRQTGAISDARFFSTVNELRNSGFRYLPLRSDELSFWLEKASVAKVYLKSSKELRTIRASVAASLENSRFLTKPSLENKGEWEFLTSLNRTLCEALPRCFRPVRDPVRSEAEADWILENLVVDFSGLRSVAGLQEPGSDGAGAFLGFLAASVCLELGGLSDEDKEARERCFRWLYSTFFHKLEASPTLLRTASASYKSILLGSRDAPEIPTEWVEPYRAVQQLYYSELPKVLQDELRRDPVFVRQLELQTRSVLAYDDDSRFDGGELMKALDRAADMGQSVVEDLLEEEWSVTFNSGKGWILTSGQKSINEPGALTIIYNFEGEISQREIEEIYPWFDCPASEIIALLSESESKLDRLISAHQILADSPEHRYGSLRAKLDQGLKHELELLLPASDKRLLSRYHLTAVSHSVDLLEALDAASRSLLTLGFETAFERLSVLPIRLPKSLVDAYGAESKAKQLEFLKQLRNRPLTPLRRLHLARLAFYSDMSCAADLGMQVLTEFIADEQSQFTNAYLAVLQWSVEHFFKYDESIHSATIRLILSWAHAEELFRCFVEARISPSQLQENFTRFCRPLAPQALRFRSKNQIYRDSSYLDQLNPRLFFVAGVCYAVGSNERAIEVVQESVMAQSYEHGEGSAFHPLCLMDLWSTNLLDGWMGRDQYAETLSKILGLDDKNALTRSGLEAQLSPILEDFQTSPATNLQCVWLMALFAKKGTCPGGFVEVCESTIVNMGLHSILSCAESPQDAETLTVSIAALAQQFSSRGQDSLYFQLLEIAKTKEGESGWAHTCFESLIYLIPPGVETEKAVQIFDKRMTTLLTAIPTYSPFLRARLTALLLEIGASQAYPLWRAVTVARASK